MQEKLKIRKIPEQDRSKATLSAIKSSASMLFEKEGIDNISMTQIANKAGMSKPAIYRYFPNKQALIRALAEDAFDYYREQIQNKLDWNNKSPTVLLLEGVTEYCNIHLKEPFRIQLRAAINADPELSRLDYEDSLENAKVIANYLRHSFPNQPFDKLELRALLITGLSDSLLRLVYRADESNRPKIIWEFVKRFSEDITG